MKAVAYMNPKISFIIPIYNISQYLEECIDSLIAQTSSQHEIILVNDGSTDGCRDICERYKECRNNIYVINKSNGGLVSARKAGIDLARGDYISCVDGDDFIKSTFVEEMTNVIDKYHPDIICSGYYVYYEGSCVEKKIPYGRGLLDKEAIRKTIFPKLFENSQGESIPANIWGKCYRRELYIEEQLAVDNHIKMGEDSACFKPCVFKANSIYILPDCLYYYRYNPNSMTKKKKPLAKDGPKLRYMHYVKRIDASVDDFQAQLYRCTVHSLYNVIVSQFWGEFDYRSACNEIKEILSDPIYQECVEKCRYRSLKNKVSLYALKYKLFPFLKLYSIRS